jgi:hypothetical protein
MLCQLAKQYGPFYVINLALNVPQDSDHTNETERIRIRDYFRYCLEVDNLEDASMEDMLKVLKRENPVTRLGEGYRKIANVAPKKKLANLNLRQAVDF